MTIQLDIIGVNKYNDYISIRGLFDKPERY